ncbi:MAG: hypothetical protein R3B06_24425 [Kofleriaceae bacterium]
MIRRWHDRAWRWLAGADGARPGLPINELLAPVPLAALAVVALNDWWWKSSGTMPGWLTGKLSDVGGVLAVPLVMTAGVDLALWALAAAGLRVDWTFRRGKLAAAIAVTVAAVVATKLSAPVAAAVTAVVGGRIVTDPSDLVALPALGVTWWHGRRTLARVPYGRVAWIARRGVAPAAGLADVAAAGAAPAAVAALTGCLAAPRDGAALDVALARLRA